MKKKIIITLFIILAIIIGCCYPVYKNHLLGNELVKNDYTQDYPWYIKNTSNGDIYVYFLTYEFFGHGEAKLLPFDTNTEIRYDGNYITYNQLSCKMKRDNDKYKLSSDATDICIDDQPSQENINKLITEYNNINDIY